ncbi:MAG: hypothetical protein ACP5E2_08600 [Terracidiphilus sp.]
MKLPAKRVVWLLPLLLTGCFRIPFHRSRSHNPLTLAPHVHRAEDIPLTVIELPPEDTVIAAQAIYNMWVDYHPIISPMRRRRLPTQNDATTTPGSAPPATSPVVSAIGQLSSGDGEYFRQQTENSIADVERRLNGIHRTLSGPEQRTAGHIREFLKQARAALASGDVEGAHTLATKAQVLLTGLAE